MILEKLPISVCILVKNEAERLPRCLGGLHSFAEVLVLDTGSTDQSVAIAKKYGAKVESSPWLGFTKNRRQLFSKATQSWILWLDADEVITEGLLGSIAKFIQNVPASIGGAKINRMVYFENKWVRHGHWFPNWNGRLFRANSWEMQDRDVHESISLKQGEWVQIDGLLEHYSFRNWEDFRRRSEKYAKLWAEQKRKEGKKGGIIKGLLHASWSFFRGYVMRKGFLDGWMGLRIAWSVSGEVMLKYKILQG